MGKCATLFNKIRRIIQHLENIQTSLITIIEYLSSGLNNISSQRREEIFRLGLLDDL